MAMRLDTHFPKTGAWNTAPIFACRQTLALQAVATSPRGYQVALAARCVR